jgi:predicted TIM-barrel fold metal-dependent hydrolase
VIYGPPPGFVLENPRLEVAVHRAFNDWAIEFNGYAPERLCVLPILPVIDVEAATVELARVAALGHRGAMFQAFRAQPPIWDAAWDRLWSVAEQTELPISIHLGGGISLLERRPGTWLMAGIATVSPLQLDEAFAAITLSGLLDRHKRLTLVLTESGLGWLPYMLERLDIQHRKYFLDGHLGDFQLERTPSQMFRDQMYATFEEDRFGVRAIPEIGADNVMWASDYPHPDSTFPHSRREIEEAFAGQPERIKTKATRDNCARLYKFRLP